MNYEVLRGVCVHVWQISYRSIQSLVAHCSVPPERRRPMATHLPRILFFALIAIFIWPSLAPAQRPPVRPAVLVHPHVHANPTLTTIHEPIDMVAPLRKV